MTIDGQRKTFEHLVPIDRRVKIELPPNLFKDVLVRFKFSNHCFSEELPPEAVAPAGHGVADGSSECPRHRVFNEERYQLSKGLVCLIDQLIADNRWVTKTKHHNYYRADDVSLMRNGQEVKVSYAIFMTAKLKDEPGQQRHLEIYIESAYPMDTALPLAGSQWSGSFGLMLGSKWNPVQTQPHRAKKAKKNKKQDAWR